MCKLFAVSGQIADGTYENRKIFFKFMSNLFLGTAHDGADQDAAGLFFWSGDRRQTIKKTGPAMNLVGTLGWRNVVSTPAKIYLCHARGAMTDATNPDNNHPFVGDNIALAHEGWLLNHREIAKKHGVELKSETDSETFMRIIDTKRRALGDRGGWDPIKAMRALLHIANAPTALAFVDYESDAPALYFARNAQSSHQFYIYNSPFFKCNFLVSTEEMWYDAMDRTFSNNVPFNFEKFMCRTEPDVIYKLGWEDQLVTDYA